MPVPYNIETKDLGLGKGLFAVFKTNKGEWTVALEEEKAPETVANFVGLATGQKEYTDPTTREPSTKPFYDGTIFHRVISNFMIQGGGMTPDMKEKKTKAPVKNEACPGLDNKRGTLAMARTNDPHSATAQFFINVADNDFLNHKQKSASGWGYCVFGKVINGMEIVDKIKSVATKTVGQYEDVPVTPVVIVSVTRVEAK